MTILAVAEARVQYDRSARNWVVWDADQTEYREAIVIGAVQMFPAGPEGKRQAQLEALRQDVPNVAADVEAVIANNAHHPQAEAITRRIVKAGFLVRDGHVLPPRPLDAPESYIHEIARVRSQGQEDVEYAVCLSPEGQTYCECQDWHNGHTLDILADYFREYPDDPQRPRCGAPKLVNGDYACKHILAVMLAYSPTEADTSTLIIYPPQPVQLEVV